MPANPASNASREDVPVKRFNLRNFKLSHGAHSNMEEGACVMELASYLAGKPFTDHPPCVSPVIGAFLRSWNDGMNEKDRQKLKPYAKKVLGTNTGVAAHEEQRAWMATDWLVRVQAPAWLDLAGLKDDATRLRNLPPLTSDEIAIGVQSVLDSVQRNASAAWSAAWSAAESAAWSAARSAAWSAAWSAAESAAWSAAWSAAESAAWSAATDSLQPTVKQLQRSAFKLVDAMIAVGKPKRRRA